MSLMPLTDSAEPYSDNKNENGIYLSYQMIMILYCHLVKPKQEVYYWLYHSSWSVLTERGEMEAAYVVRCTKDGNNNVVGTYCHDPMLNSMVYDIEFPNGEIKE